MTELKPCPFCGSAEGRLNPVENHEGTWWVDCENCFCEGPWSKTKEYAIAAWNTRHYPRCKDCRWWNDSYTCPDDWLEFEDWCGHDLLRGKIKGEGPDFGCVRWEAKG